MTDADKATILNNHFSSVFTVDDGLNHVFTTRCTDRLSSVEFPPYIVYHKLSKLKRSFSCGPDGIPKILLKMLASEISIPLARIYEYSFSNGVLPLMWRCADVVPLFKKGSTSDPGNYRPISLTCTCCRVMESIIKDSLSQFLLSHSLISPYQHGFTAGRSPCTQLLECLDDWSKCVRDNIGVFIVYIDFAKAFDTVNHRKLLIKLRGYGICNGIISWIRSFLTNRFQRVKIGSTYSTWLPVTSGVPQGSVLGPLLFLLYVNDLPESFPSAVTSKLFADDLKLYAPVSDSYSLQHALHLLLEWCSMWQLHIQPLKCHVLPIGCAINDDTVFSLGAVALNRVNSCRDLGVVMSSSLTFVEHYTTVFQKASRTLAFLLGAFERGRG
ncbi:MAG: reverse transcriptase family protein, partial [Gammaproteobacteria bacterium]|nr:reverse transcriptase family protein [Gammaproteobacteria bacterium]